MGWSRLVEWWGLVVVVVVVVVVVCALAVSGVWCLVSGGMIRAIDRLLLAAL